RRAVDRGGGLVDPPHDVADPDRPVPEAGHAGPKGSALAGLLVEDAFADGQGVRGAVGDLYDADLAVLEHDAAHVLIDEEKRVGDGAGYGAIVRQAVKEPFRILFRGRVGRTAEKGKGQLRVRSRHRRIGAAAKQLRIHAQFLVEGILFNIGSHDHAPSPSWVEAGRFVRRRKILKRRRVVVQAQRELLQVVFALHLGGGFTHALHGRHQKGNQNGDDGNDDQKFDQRKS